MLLTYVNIARLRNLKTVVLDELQPFNVFVGANGSGKTSVLEALHILATGRSFRTHIPRHYIMHGEQDCLVFAKTQEEQFGLQKYLSGEQHIRVNGEKVLTLGELAKKLPIQVIEPQSIEIIDQGASLRRALLDWLMFHVEPRFYPLWLNYMRVLKQRNQLLKSLSVKPQELMAWDELLADVGEQIHLLRLKVVEDWQEALQQELVQLLPNLKIQMEYFAGFDREQGLKQQLQHNHTKDIERRVTQYGIHRADIRLKTEYGDVDRVLSRGQKKLLIVALKLAQLVILHRLNRQTVVLLDDLDSELDNQAQQRLIHRLGQLNSQVFITTLHQNVIQRYLTQSRLAYCIYHVEAGQLSRIPD